MLRIRIFIREPIFSWHVFFYQQMLLILCIHYLQVFFCLKCQKSDLIIIKERFTWEYLRCFTCLESSFRNRSCKWFFFSQVLFLQNFFKNRYFFRGGVKIFIFDSSEERERKREQFVWRTLQRKWNKTTKRRNEGFHIIFLRRLFVELLLLDQTFCAKLITNTFYLFLIQTQERKVTFCERKTIEQRRKSLKKTITNETGNSCCDMRWPVTLCSRVWLSFA